MMENISNTTVEIIKIAVVEDDKTVREGLKMLIDGSPGLSCVSAFHCGEDALEDIPKIIPDVVLMDINLPGISGIDCIRSMKEQDLQTLFIMLTVFEDADAIFDSLAAGASGYILKNTPPSKLLEAILEVQRGGSPMSGEIARKVVASFQKTDIKTDNDFGLTKREDELLSYLAKGYLYKEIADVMYISIDTVRSHIRHIYEKLHVKTRTEAVLRYLNK